MKTAFLDIDTQLDFLFPSGALYAAGAERICEPLGVLTAFAAEKKIPIISTSDSHAEDDAEFRIWKPHCVVGTQGHQKYSRTMAPAHAKQILVPKNTIDVFASGRMEDALATVGAEHYVVYGLITEYCIRAAAFGLLSRKARVAVVIDAIHSLDAAEGQRILEHFKAEGGRLTTVSQVIASADHAIA